jgi:hypothetical protein
MSVKKRKFSQILKLQIYLKEKGLYKFIAENNIFN